ncbi:MAG: isoprenyl transferase [Phycisphaerales bacterium]|nr:isoprenyl transferase [Phycisphaerales bacterium]
MTAAATTPQAHPLGLDASRVPKHVAIIMDGNGRWAEDRGLPRIWGHREGAVRVRDVVERAGDLGVTHLTLYAFSSENWKRPQDEISQLMLLCVAYLDGEAERLTEEGIRLRVIGRREGLPDEVRAAIERVEGITEHATRANLTLALNYGGRDEIVDACRAIAAKATAGEITPEAIDQDTVARHLYTADLPDPDLLIRTAGEHRLSNYLLWQVSYAELFISEAAWPEFDADRFDEAVLDYAGRTRRFGKTDAQLEGTRPQ